MNKNKILGYALLFIAAIMIVLGFVKPNLVDEFNVFWMSAVLALIPGLLFTSNRPAAAIYFSRIILGSVFLVSGLIKANDTIGFGFKLEEYFDENALGTFWANFHDSSLILAILISGIEVLLGLAVLFGLKIRLVSIVLVSMTLFFGWLTYFTAHCNDLQMQAMSEGMPFTKVCVTDCGCFGDAMRGSVGRSLTPWESFYKDLGLFFLTIVLLFNSGTIQMNKSRDDFAIIPLSIFVIAVFGGWLFGWWFPLLFFFISVGLYHVVRIGLSKKKTAPWIVILTLALLTYGFTYVTYYHLPIKDFRPYAVGKNIKDQMKSAKELGLEPTEYATIYKMKHMGTGEERTVNSKVYLEESLWKDSLWQITFSSPEPLVLKRGYEPPIVAFNVMNEDGSDIGDELLNDENYSLMIVMYNIKKSEAGKTAENIRDLVAKASESGMDTYAITSSGYDLFETYKHDNQWPVEFFSADEIFLKTIIRANPGVVLLRNGLIIEKWSSCDVPNFNELQTQYLKD